MSSLIHSIKYPFAIDNGLGKLQEEHDFHAHVVQMIKQVLFTNPGERINRPDFGCGLRRMVFEPNSMVTVSLLHVTIAESLDRWLGNVITVLDVKAEAIEERLEVGIVYFVKARQEKRFLNVEVTL